MLHYKSFKRRR